MKNLEERHRSSSENFTSINAAIKDILSDPVKETFERRIQSLRAHRGSAGFREDMNVMHMVAYQALSMEVSFDDFEGSVIGCLDMLTSAKTK